jgi:predicted alpha/beta hydrolase family esterase
MGRPAYLILHGYESSGPGHWQTWLAGRLRAGEANVRYPDLPDADAPQLRSWLEALAGELDILADPPVVICHSLACLLWLHHVDRGGEPAERVLFVAPPSETGAPDDLAPFFPAPRPALEHTRLVCSDDDPYCPEGALELYGRPLGLETDLFPGAGHINPEAGFGAWPAVEAWAREGTVPLTAPEPARG